MRGSVLSVGQAGRAKGIALGLAVICAALMNAGVAGNINSARAATELRWIPVTGASGLEVGYRAGSFKYDNGQYVHYFWIRNRNGAGIRCVIEVAVDGDSEKRIDLEDNIAAGQEKKIYGGWTICRAVMGARLRSASYEAVSAQVVEGDVSLTGVVLPDKATAILKDILATAGLRTAQVLSTQRTYSQQVQEMIAYFKRNGESMAMQTYSGGPGRSAMDYYRRAADRDAQATLDEMVRIIRVGLEEERKSGGQVHLMHTSETHYVFDVSMESIGAAGKDADWRERRAAFVAAVEKAVKAGSVSRFLHPASTPPDKAYHLEIPR